MAWYPGAVKMELQPESDSQPAIRPTQFIVHSIVAPWTARRTYEYWRDSTNLESHFAVDYAGTVAQFIGTETRADANAGANRRPDGTGAVSAETASNTSASDPWNDKQIEDLIALGVWLHQRHGIPLRICRSHDDPGYGYHRLHRAWSTSGTACPGDARVRQFREVVFPGIVARATGNATTTGEEENMPSPEEIAAAVWRHPIENQFRKDAQGKPRRIAAEDFLEYGDSHHDQLVAMLQQLTAQGAARDAVLARLAEGGGLDAAEIQAAAEAGAQAALDRLGDALTKES